MKLKDLKALSYLLNEEMRKIREKNNELFEINNPVIRTIKDANDGLNLLIVELDGVERLDDNDAFTDAVDDAKTELDAVVDALSNLQWALNKVNDLTDGWVKTDSVETELDDLRDELDDLEPKDLTDDERDELSVDDLLAKVIKDEQ